MKQDTRLGVYGIAKVKGCLLLTKKISGPYLGLLDLPGGKIEFGESPEVALRREFKEEVAMGFNKMKLIDNLCINLTCGFHHLGMIYAVSGLKPIKNAIAEDDYDFYPINKLTAQQLTPFAAEVFKRLK